jgi:hypothetical protein
MKHGHFNRMSCMAMVAGLILLPASCLAAGKEIRAKFVYDGVADCESPAVRDFPIHTEGTGTLAVDRHASLDVSSNVAGHERYETTLGGKPTEAEAGSASLRVLGKHHLQAIRSYPNNLLIADIIVSGNSCSLTVDNRFKPGKRQYTFTTRFGGLAYCGRPRVTHTSCEPI